MNSEGDLSLKDRLMSRFFSGIMKGNNEICHWILNFFEIFPL